MCQYAKQWDSQSVGSFLDQTVWTKGECIVSWTHSCVSMPNSGIVNLSGLFWTKLCGPKVSV